MLLFCFGFGKGLVKYCSSLPLILGRWCVANVAPRTKGATLKQQRFQLVCQDRNLRIMMTNMSGKKKEM